MGRRRVNLEKGRTGEEEERLGSSPCEGVDEDCKGIPRSKSLKDMVGRERRDKGGEGRLGGW